MKMKKIDITDIEGFRLGNAENAEAGTGVTVIIAEDGAVAGVDVRGGGPATRETDLLRPENTVDKVHAIVLSGGSAFGLEAASGVMRSLAARGIGFQVDEGICVPIVPVHLCMIFQSDDPMCSLMLKWAAQLSRMHITVNSQTEITVQVQEQQ